MRIKKENDRRLKDLLLDRINWDFRISSSDIKILVRDGIVSIYGYFDKEFRRTAAIHSISNTQGVLSIIDNTHVIKDYYRSDQEIEVILSKRLLEKTFSDQEKIEISVRNGEVIWTGNLRQRRLKSWLSKITWELSGVKDCYNLVRLSCEGPPTANQNQASIDFKTFTNIENAVAL